MNIACTLFEKDFHLGLAALLNSLAASGFVGKFIAGYRGKIPFWVSKLKQGVLLDTFEVSPEFKIQFKLIETEFHFTHFKPQFFLEIFEEEDVDKLFYFDPDITLRAPWKFMLDWVDHGIPLCQDVIPIMPTNHPVKQVWKKTAKNLGLTIFRETDVFYNAGFVGIKKEQKDFLELWAKIIDKVWSKEELKEFCPANRKTRLEPFFIADQDAFNLATMVTSHEVSTVGPESMDFVPGGSIMSHAIGASKPWNKNFTISALMAIPPTRADKFFWIYAEKGPIKPFSTGKLKLKKIDLLIGSIIGRFMRRS